MCTHCVRDCVFLMGSGERLRIKRSKGQMVFVWVVLAYSGGGGV